MISIQQAEVRGEGGGRWLAGYGDLSVVDPFVVVSVVCSWGGRPAGGWGPYKV